MKDIQILATDRPAFTEFSNIKIPMSEELRIKLPDYVVLHYRRPRLTLFDDRYVTARSLGMELRWEGGVPFEIDISHNDRGPSAGTIMAAAGLSGPSLLVGVPICKSGDKERFFGLPASHNSNFLAAMFSCLMSSDSDSVSVARIHPITTETENPSYVKLMVPILKSIGTITFSE